jgi:L-iditol 2-dehydrogenase
MIKTVRLHAPRDIRVHDEPLPVPRPGEVLVRVTAAGICGSDIHWYREGGIGDAKLGQPRVIGHEAGGVIASGGRAGQRVAIEPGIACRRCERCESGDPNLCTNLRFSGSDGETDGMFREMIAWPEDLLFPVPDELGDADVALLEPLGIGLFSMDLGHPGPGSTVGVFGCGPIWLMLIQLARLAGASRVFATDIRAHRLEAAARAGASDCFPADRKEAERILEVTAGRGVDVAFEVAGENPAVEAAIEAARYGGRVVLVGIPEDDRTWFRASVARQKGLTLKLVRRMKHVYPRAIDLAAQGRLDLGWLVTHRFPWERGAEAFEVAERREGLKVVFAPGD